MTQPEPAGEPAQPEPGGQRAQPGGQPAQPGGQPARPESAGRPAGSGPASRPTGERPTEHDLKPMNDEIVALVAAYQGRDVADLVPEVEAVMRRYGAPEPNREGILQWIEGAQASVRSRAAGS